MKGKFATKPACRLERKRIYGKYSVVVRTTDCGSVSLGSIPNISPTEQLAEWLGAGLQNQPQRFESAIALKYAAMV